MSQWQATAYSVRQHWQGITANNYDVFCRMASLSTQDLVPDKLCDALCTHSDLTFLSLILSRSETIAVGLVVWNLPPVL